jgi:hypothetical protein
MLVLVPVRIVYLGETDNKLAARSSYGTGYGLPVQPIAKFGVASPGFAAASEFATEPAVDARFGAKWKMDRSCKLTHVDGQPAYEVTCDVSVGR